MTAQIHCDVCVLGGGPAGSVAASRLAQMGYHVCLVDGPLSNSKSQRIESLSPICRELLDFTGLPLDWAQISPRPVHRMLLAWESPSAVVRYNPRPHLVVNRALFDAALRTAATATGVELLPALASRPIREQRGWIIRVCQPNHRSSCDRVCARFVINATGRFSRRDAIETGGSYRTMSFLSSCSCSAAKSATMVLEACNDFCMWGYFDGAGNCHNVVFTDPVPSRALSSDTIRTFLGRALQSTRYFSDCAVNSVRVVDATPRLSTRIVQEGMIAIGDAATRSDPLSSQGVQTAIVSALRGAVVVNTVLSIPQRQQLAMTFHQYRTLDSARAQFRLTAEAYRHRRNWNSTPFWLSRQSLQVMPATRPLTSRIEGDLVVT